MKSAFVFVYLAILLLPVTAFSKNGHSEIHAKRVTTDFIVPTSNSVPFPFSGREIIGRDGQRFRYYSSNIEERAMATVIFLPGSGCTGAFAPLPGGHRAMGPEAFALEFATQSRLIVFENPGIGERFAREPAAGCTSDFRQAENMQSRLEALQTIVDDLKARGWISHLPFMLVASSEGVTLATRFAALSQNVTHLLLISGFGIGQPVATVHAALTDWGNWSFVPANSPNDQLARLRSTLERWEKVHRAQTSRSDEVIAGHDLHYWRSMGIASPAEDALSTRAHLYLVQGGKDESASYVDYEAGLAYLVAHGRPFVSEFIACGDHFLMCNETEGETPYELKQVIERGMQWFLTGAVQDASAVTFDPFDPSAT